MVLHVPPLLAQLTRRKTISITNGSESVSACVRLKSDDTLKLRKALYDGETKLIDAQRLENEWVVLAFDDISEPHDLKNALKAYRIEDEYVSDYETPRDSAWLLKTWNARITKLFCGDELILTHKFDPQGY